MPNNLIIVLEITVIGMGLVFGAIILLWGVMSVLMRLTVERKQVETQSDFNDLLLKQRAAIAAVMVAIASEEVSNKPHEFPLPPTPLVSAWQAVMRSKMLNKRGPVR